MKNKRKLLWIIGVLVIVFISVQAGLDEIKASLGQAEIEILILLFGLQLFTLALTSYQWFYLLNKDKKRINFPDVFAIYLSGSLIESITPSSKLGGEAAKVYLFRKESGLSYEQLTGRLIAHKFIMLLPFLLLAIISLAFASLEFSLPAFVYLAVLIFAILFGIFTYLNFKTWDNSNKASEEGNLLLEKIIAGKEFLKRAIKSSKELLVKKELILLLIISFLVWGLYPVKLYLVSQMLGLSASFWLVMTITYAAYLVSMLPLTPGGLGTFEGSVALIFSLNGFAFAQGLSVALLSRLITYWIPLIVSTLAALYIISVKNFEVFSASGGR